MLDNYSYLNENLINVTDAIEKDSIIKENIIFRTIIQKNLIVDKYYHKRTAVRNGNAMYHLGYEFIKNDNVYILVLLDNYKESSWTTLDDWDNLDIFFTNDVDMNYIKETKSYIIFNIPIEWFLIEENLGAMCEYEMNYIHPLIRKWKIKNLLK